MNTRIHQILDATIKPTPNTPPDKLDRATHNLIWQAAANTDSPTRLISLITDYNHTLGTNGHHYTAIAITQMATMILEPILELCDAENIPVRKEFKRTALEIKLRNTAMSD